MRKTLASGQSTSISTLTPLTGWLDVSTSYQLLLFWAKPLDPALQIALHIESAEEDQPDTEFTDPVGDVGKQVSWPTAGPPVVRSKYRLSAYSVGPGGTHPVTTINWGVVAATSAPVQVTYPGP